MRDLSFFHKKTPRSSMRRPSSSPMRRFSSLLWEELRIFYEKSFQSSMRKPSSPQYEDLRVFNGKKIFWPSIGKRLSDLLWEESLLVFYEMRRLFTLQCEDFSVFYEKSFQSFVRRLPSLLLEDFQIFYKKNFDSSIRKHPSLLWEIFPVFHAETFEPSKLILLSLQWEKVLLVFYGKKTFWFSMGIKPGLLWDLVFY